MSTTNASRTNEQDFKSESLTTAQLSDKSGRLNAATQNIVAVQSLVNPAANTDTLRYRQPSSFLEDVNSRYLL